MTSPGKTVLSITYQKCRKPCVSHRAPTIMGVLWRKGWPVGKACPSAIIFLTHLSVKKMNAAKSWMGNKLENRKYRKEVPILF